MCRQSLGGNVVSAVGIMIKKGGKMGLREDVKRGKISIDEALETARDYHGGIRGWLIGFKKSLRKNPLHKGRKKKKDKGRNFSL